MGEGWGGGGVILEATLPLTPSHQGRGNCVDLLQLIARVGAKDIIRKPKT
jgi:hypothetical protein